MNKQQHNQTSNTEYFTHDNGTILASISMIFICE